MGDIGDQGGIVDHSSTVKPAAQGNQNSRIRALGGMMNLIFYWWRRRGVVFGEARLQGSCDGHLTHRGTHR